MKKVVIGCNFGPYKNWMGLFLTKYELRNKDLVSVRDRESFELLSQFNLKKPKIILADDIVYNMLPELSKTDTSSKIFVISVYRSIRKPDINKNLYETLAKVSDKLIEKTGGVIKLFAFDCETENDLVAAFHIKRMMKFPNNTEVVPYLGNEKEFLQEYASCNRMVSVRFHSAVLADLLNIPFLPIAYSNKMKNLMIRRFLPKGTKQTTAETVAWIENWINHYLRKIFACKSSILMSANG